ncbi:MAG: hypothetical protein JW860_10280 [Sedimentisphaerales bacterium]|nr:hypothetical protein [Sedimentisphaerales bacterium]
MINFKGKFVGIILWLIVIVCALQLLYSTGVRGYNTYKYRKILGESLVTLSMTPPKETWHAKPGLEVPFGYMSIKFPAGSIKSIQRISDTSFGVELPDDILLIFTAPVSEITLQRSQSVNTTASPDITSLSKSDQPASPDTQTVDITEFDKVEACYYEQPKGVMEYFFMKDDEHAEHLKKLTIKSSNSYAKAGIIIFDAEHIQGLLFLGNTIEEVMICNIWGKKGKVFQSIQIIKKQGTFSSEDKAEIKSILASIRYNVDKIPGKSELAQMLTDALLNLIQYTKPMQPEPAVDKQTE